MLADRFRLLRPIGGGGIGKVYEAEIVRTSMPVAVKMMHPLLAGDTRALSFLERECSLVSQVAHDALVPVYDIGEDIDGVPFLVMEYLRGRNLRTKLAEDNVVSVRDALWIGWHVADALAAAHGARLVHQNLKPENIFLQDQRHVSARVRILDFGVARTREHLSGQTLTISRDGKALGTPRYMSPEQACGGRDLDRRSDVYSLAVVIYEALTGQSPYPGGDAANSVDLLRMIEASEAIPLRHLRPDATRTLEALLSSALQKNRDERIDSMETLMVELSTIAAEPLPGAPITDLEWGDDRLRTGSRGSRSKRIRKPTIPPQREH